MKGRDFAMSTLPVPASPQGLPFELVPPGLSLEELSRNAQHEIKWLWQGYLAPENMTLLTSQWKAGKTTLLAVLLAKLKTGGELAGLAVRPGRAAVISEESATIWHGRRKKLDFGDHVWWCHPFRGKPTREEWQGLMDRVVA